jgi:hypothetical protein
VLSKSNARIGQGRLQWRHASRRRPSLALSAGCATPGFLIRSDQLGRSKLVTTTYACDDLNRLLSASSSGAVSGNFLKTYTYNAIGNIASSTDLGAYSYAGTGYANPHAPTTIGSTAYVYDNNGNVTSYGTTTVTWDYRNRITRIVGNGATTSYAYDINNERIQIAGNASTTTYPFMLYNVASSTSAKIISKHVFANGEGAADVQGTGASAKAYNIHGDHAGGS